MTFDNVPSRPRESRAEFDVIDLTELNLEPVGYLGRLAIELGGETFGAYRHAANLVLRHGSSRRIDLPAALAMCDAIRAWAYAHPDRFSTGRAPSMR